MEKDKLIASILLGIVVILATILLQVTRIIDIMANIIDIWIPIAAFLLGIAYIWFTKSISKKTTKKPVNETKKDEYLYGKNIGSIDNGIHYFRSQEELPQLSQVLKCAKDRIEILAWSSEDIATQHIDSLKSAVVNRNIQVTIMVLAPDSDIAAKGDIAIASIDLPKRIENCLKILCDERNKLEDKKRNFIIKKYYVDNNHSMIILDPYTDNAWIQVTSYVKGVDASSRHSESAFKKENEPFFKKYYDEYLSILKKAKEHKCK